MDGHMSRVFSVQYTPGQDNEFLSGGWDDTVQVIKMLRLYRSENLSLFSECATTLFPPSFGQTGLFFCFQSPVSS